MSPEQEEHFAIVNSQAVYDVLEERARQISKGYDPTHDDEHGGEELTQAAMSYIWRPWNIRDNLVKAVACLIAEIERLDRKNARNRRT